MANQRPFQTIESQNVNETQSSGSKAGTIALVVTVIALLAANIYFAVRLNSVQADFSQFKKSAEAEFASLHNATTAEQAVARQNLELLRSELDAAKAQAAVAVGQAKIAAERHVNQLAKKVTDAQQQQAAQMSSQITEVKESTMAKLNDVNSDVTNVKTEVASTKSDLQNTISELHRATGDMGVMSGLIATNQKELEALKAMGERNYFEFDIAKSSAPQRVGTIAVRLKKADLKRNKFTVVVVADDKTVEKKDKTINEPVQFYVAGARLPYEMVVNQVHKDRIIGYLATPKLQTARTTAASSEKQN